MKERIILQEMKEEGIKEGERKGRREGERKGRREGRREGVRKGRREGTQKEKVRTITGMLARNMPLKDIADICSCSVKYVKEVESRMVDAGK